MCVPTEMSVPLKEKAWSSCEKKKKEWIDELDDIKLEEVVVVYIVSREKGKRLGGWMGTS